MSSEPSTTLVQSQSLWRPALLWTLALEALTLLLRFGAGLESTRDTASTIGRLTFGLRIHHSYVGLFVSMIALALIHQSPRFARYLLIAGIALVLSDVIHHFIVLAWWVGDPQFDLWYDG